MPELPEVETVRRGLAPYLVGAEIASVRLNRAGLRFPFPENFVSRLEGQKISHLDRRAKYLLIGFQNGETLLSHLGMTGNFRFRDHVLKAPSRYHANGVAAVVESQEDGKHDHVIFTLKGEADTGFDLIYSDPRRFGFMDLFADLSTASYLKSLGPEPLGNEMSAQALAERFKGRRTPIKAALLDQANIAGLGNIYVSEALWRAGIAPTSHARALVTASGQPLPALDLLVKAIREVLEAAIAAGGSTLKDFRQADGETGYFQHRFDVYDRKDEPCRRQGCAGKIARLVQSGRASYFCPVCQPEFS